MFLHALEKISYVSGTVLVLLDLAKGYLVAYVPSESLSSLGLVGLLVISFTAGASVSDHFRGKHGKQTREEPTLETAQAKTVHQSTQISNEIQAIPKRETLRRFVNELSILEAAQGYYPVTVPTLSISHLIKLNHQTVLEICRNLGDRELLTVKEMDGHAIVGITSRGQKVLREAG